jgi:cysteinyl-tRNA synthetase
MTADTSPIASLRIHNSMSGRKEALRPIRSGEIRMYVCGDTVYDFCHIGHARSKIAFDVVRRWLQHRGLRVTFVRNITDIDDKIIRRAAELGETIAAFTERFISAMHEDYDRLGILRPTHEPRATQYVEQMIALTKQLIDGGHAYVASDGDVMYSVSSFAPYGQLSGKKLADLRAGSRIEVDHAKHDPLDFVLWKQSKAGEPAWESPWGPGRPGWHIECSAMSAALLGTHFDIHGGGMDLKFPHHENEIAQSCAASGDHFANLWMHNGFVNVDDEKMSKSLGNFFTIRDVLNRRDAAGDPLVRHPEVLRFFLLSSHYRGPINYSLDQINQADATLGGLYNALRGLDVTATNADNAAGAATLRFAAAMDDDFNTAEAVAVLKSLEGEINRARTAGQNDAAALRARELVSLGQVLGVLMLDPEEWFRLRKADFAAASAVATGTSSLTRIATGQVALLNAADIDALVAERDAARAAKNFKLSDEIRDRLLAAGVIVEDKRGQKTTWRYR